MRIGPLLGWFTSLALIATTIAVSYNLETLFQTDKFFIGLFLGLGVIGAAVFGIQLMPKDIPPFTGPSEDRKRPKLGRDGTSTRTEITANGMSMYMAPLDTPKATPTSPTGRTSTQNRYGTARSTSQMDRYGNLRSDTRSDSTVTDTNVMTGVILYDQLGNIVEAVEQRESQVYESRAQEAPSTPEPETRSSWATESTSSYESSSDNSSYDSGSSSDSSSSFSSD